MSTRVSWIDEVHLQGLLERLEAPPPVSPSPIPHAMTLAEAEDSPLPFFEEEQPEAPEPADQSAEWSEPDSRPVAKAQPFPPAEKTPQEPASGAATDDVVPPLDRIRERLRMIRHRAAAAGMLSHSMPTDQSSAPAPDSPEARLAAFARQVLAALPEGTKLLILEADGDVVWNNDPKPGLVLSTLMALKAARQGSVDAPLQHAPEVIHHAMPPDEILSIFSHAKPGGLMQIAIRTREVVPLELIAPWRVLL